MNDSVDQVMAWHQTGARYLPEPMMFQFPDTYQCWFCIWLCGDWGKTYRKTSNIRRTLVGNKIVDHSDVVGASPVGAAPTTSSFST